MFVVSPIGVEAAGGEMSRKEVPVSGSSAVEKVKAVNHFLELNSGPLLIFQTMQLARKYCKNYKKPRHKSVGLARQMHDMMKIK